MTGEQFKNCRHSLGWSVRQAANRFLTTPRTLRRWEAGSLPLPGGVIERMNGFIGATIEVAERGK